MSMQISVDPAALSQEQREAVAGFILAYPSSAGTCGHAVAEIPAFIHKDTADQKLVELGRSLDPAVNELEVLQHDHESTLPVAAFGQPVVDEAAAAFGVPPVPLGVSVPLAVSTPAIAAGSTVAPSPPANTAPITTTPGVASSVAGVGTGAASPFANTATGLVTSPAQMVNGSASAVAQQAGVDLDAKGLPWDGRIHSSGKTKLADGSWRKKGGVPPERVVTVEAELRQLMGAPGVTPLAPTTAPIAPTPPLAPAAPVTANLPTASVSQPVAAPLPPAVTPAPVAGEVPADARGMFVALVGRASAAIQGQKVTQAEVNQCCADAGVPALPLLANRLDLVAQVAAHIDALIAARQ